MRDVVNTLQYTDAKFLGVGFDLNEARVPGWYAVTDPENGPDDGNWFLEITASEQFGGVLFQKATLADGSSVQTRTYSSGSWAAWVDLIGDLAGRVTDIENA